MTDDDTARAAIRTLLPERLSRLQQVSGLPVVFGGITTGRDTAHQMVLKHFAGTLSDALHDLVVTKGRGLGGTVLQRGTPCRVNDYASTAAITHDYDRAVVEAERLKSIVAVPILVNGTVLGVLYGAVRDQQPIGDTALRNFGVIASHLRRDVESLLVPRSPVRPQTRSQSALDDLAAVIASTSDPVLRQRLARIHENLGGHLPAVAAAPVLAPALLAPREIDALRLVAVGSSNLDIADQLGLSPQTVKAYLRTAMRKLDVRNRTAAVHAARVAGLL